MVDAIISFAVQRLGDYLIQEAVFRAGVRGEVEWLRDELGSMRSFIRDAEEKQAGGNHRVRKWVSDIRTLADDAVDTLERFTCEVETVDEAPKHSIMDYMRCCACICNKEAKLYHIGKEIEWLKTRLTDLSRKRDAYGIGNIIGNSGEGTSNGQHNNELVQRQLRRTTSYADEVNVVGFQDVIDTLVAELLKDDPRRSVVSIYGMGGLGKTTLARELYNSVNATCHNHFHYQAWICVSQEYRIEDLFQSIIKSFNKGSTTKEELDRLIKMSLGDLERHLREFLKGKRYLVVIDDVWHKEAWESLRRAFPEGNNGSRVIITTRNREIAERADDNSFAHELRFMTPEESWKLFCKKAFRGDDEVGSYRPPAFEELGKEMVKKCDGLPLAIIVLGGLLAHKRGPAEWRKVKDNIWRHLKDDKMEISQLLSLSYYDLSPEVKQCFLYLGEFPEDYVINVEKLIQLWMAEEFIPQGEGEERLEDVAEKYLNELIDRSLIQVDGTFWEKIVTCRVHDLLRDLALHKAREVSFFDIFDPRPHKHLAPLPCRRYVIQSQIHKYFSLDVSNSKLRSLVFFNPDREKLSVEHVTVIVEKFKLLRVLDLDHFSIGGWNGQLPDEIGEMIHLKFLGLKNANVRVLPPSIGNLKRLQTLVANCELPPEICELKQLRHLLVRYDGNCLNASTLTNLQTLRYVSFSNWTEIDADNLVNLRELALYRKIRSSFSLDSIAKLESLDTLILSPTNDLPPLQPLSSCQHLVNLWLNGTIQNLPAPNELPQSLTILTLSGSQLQKDPMPTLEMLPQLRSLELGYLSYFGNKIVCSAKGFPQLELLRLSYLHELEDWTVEEGAMPMIRGLGIYNCTNLKMVPERLKYLPAIQPSENIYWLPGYHD